MTRWGKCFSIQPSYRKSSIKPPGRSEYQRPFMSSFRIPPPAPLDEKGFFVVVAGGGGAKKKEQEEEEEEEGENNQPCPPLF